jgi:hypothetical protein
MALIIILYTLSYFILNRFLAAYGLVADRPWRRKWWIIERENLWERDGKIRDVVQRDFCGAHYVYRPCETIRKNIAVCSKRSRSLSPACARFDSRILSLHVINIYVCTWTVVYFRRVTWAWMARLISYSRISSALRFLLFFMIFNKYYEYTYKHYILLGWVQHF